MWLRECFCSQNKTIMFFINIILLISRFFLALLSTIWAFFLGFFHSLDVVTLFFYLRESKELRRIIGLVFVMNFVFFASLWVTSFFFSMMCVFFSNLFFGGGGSSVYVNNSFSCNGDSNVNISGGSCGDFPKSGVEILNVGSEIGFLGKVWFHVFDIMWVIPMYLITQLVGVCWYNTIYIEACAIKKRRVHANRLQSFGEEGCHVDDVTFCVTNSKATESSFSVVKTFVFFSEVLFKFVVTAVYTVLITVVDSFFFLPLGQWIAFVMKSWLYSFYVFDYRLSSQYVFNYRLQRTTRLTLSGSLKIFESHWSYFLGFGSFYCFLTTELQSSLMFSWFSVAAVTSVLFGVHVVLSVEASLGPCAPFAFQMFTPLFALCAVILRVFSNAVS